MHSMQRHTNVKQIDIQALCKLLNELWTQMLDCYSSPYNEDMQNTHAHTHTSLLRYAKGDIYIYTYIHTYVGI